LRIGPLILIQLTIKHRATLGVMQDHVYQMPAEDVADLRKRLIDTRYKALLTLLLMNGIRDFRGMSFTFLQGKIS